MSAKIRNIVAAVFLTLAAADAVITPFACNQSKAAETASRLKEAKELVGNAAPDFSLTDSNGKKVALGDYKGKFVVLEWVNYDCPFVQKHYGSNNMQNLQEKYTGKGVIWLCINSSAANRQGNYPPAKINELIKSHKAHPTAYLIDEDGKVGRAYGARTTPSMYVIDKAGKVVYAGAIDDKSTTDEADIKTATNYVEAALDQVMAGKPVATSYAQSYGCSVKY